MMNSKLFISNFKFRKSNKNENSIYKEAESLNSTKTTILDTTLNSTINLDDKSDDSINDVLASIPSNFDHVLPADQIVIHKELGKGDFGIVRQGVWTNDNGQSIQVAIKCLCEQRMNKDKNEFIKEAAIMHRIAHKNIVRFYGVIMDGNSLMIVTELAPLKSLLECLKDQTIKTNFTVSLLCDFAYQICDGMQYLEKNRLIHLDLAARNILVFNKNLVKISDFGLSRALGVGKNYYQLQYKESLRLPVAWCSPESINFLKFTSASDVWSYGVTLYEIFSYGFEPWNSFTGLEILTAIDYPNYQRLEQPDYCPKDYYSIMLKCWEHDPEKRPKFCEIIKILPDCKPELVQAVKDSNNENNNLQSNDNQFSSFQQSNQHLNFKIGDIITVLDKNLSMQTNENQKPNQLFWKGCLNDGQVGLFNPNLTVSYLGSDLPNCNSVLQTNNQTNHHQNNSNLNQNGMKLTVFLKSFLEKDKTNQNSKKKIKAEMISKPQNDLKHTAHVGADGAFFGDLSCLGNKYQAPKKQMINSFRTNNNDSLDQLSTLSRNSSDISDKTPLLNNKLIKNESLEKLNIKDKRNSKHLTLNTNGHLTNDQHEYHEISEDEDCLRSPKFKPLDFGPSLMDEVFKELNFGLNSDFEKELNFKNLNFNEQNNTEKQNKNQQEKSQENKATLLPTKKKQALVKPVSAADQQSLDSAIAMVQKLATKPMFNSFDNLKPDSLTLLDNCSINADSPRFSVTSPTKKKFTFKFKSGKENKENKTFSDQLNKHNDNLTDSILSQEAKVAYESLVESGINNNGKKSAKNDSNNENKNENKNENNKSIAKAAKSIFSKNISRSTLPKPPPVPVAQTLNRSSMNTNNLTINISGNNNLLNNQLNNNFISNNSNYDTQNCSSQISPQTINGLIPPNALPLPPRDRNRNFMQLRHHERRHPLIIPEYDLIDSLQQATNNKLNETNMPKQLMSTFKPNMPLHRNVSFNEATKQNTFINNSSLANSAMQPNLINDQKCSQIPANSFIGLPILKDDQIKLNNNKDFVELTLKNRNIKIDLNKEADEIRLMQKILANAHQLNVTSNECLETLKLTNMDLHKAIKIIQLKETLKSQSIYDECDWFEILNNFNWQTAQAINHLIAKHLPNNGTTAV